MKKSRFFLLAASAMLLAGCANDEPAVTGGGGYEDGCVKFNVEIPGMMASRSIAQAEYADELTYVVFDDQGQYLHAENLGKVIKDKKATVTVPLAKGMTYTVAFVAKSADSPYTIEDGVLKMNYGAANSDHCDAFYWAEEIVVKEGMDAPEATLTRPFAQVNIGAIDWEAMKNLKQLISETSLSFTAQVYGGMNLCTGNVDGTATEVDFTYALLPDHAGTDAADQAFAPATLTAGGEDYSHVAMAYVLVPKGLDASPVNTITFKYKKGATEMTENINSVPVQRNHRTNIVGRFFTEGIEYNIFIDQRFDLADPDINVEYPMPLWTEEVKVPTNISADGKSLSIESPEEFAYIAQQVNSGADNFEGKTITLTEDLDLAGKAWTPIGQAPYANSAEFNAPGNITVDLTSHPPYGLKKVKGEENMFLGHFDGNGHTIKNLTSIATGDNARAGLFGTTVCMATNQYQFHKIGNFTIDGATISAIGTNAKAGAVAAEAFGTNMGGSSHSKANFNYYDITVKNSNITSNGAVGGIIGVNMRGAAVGRCTIENCQISNTATTWGGSTKYLPDDIWELTSKTLEALTNEYNTNPEKYSNSLDNVLSAQLTQYGAPIAGGVIGYSEGPAVIYGDLVKDCQIDGYFAGGLVGAACGAAQWTNANDNSYGNSDYVGNEIQNTAITYSEMLRVMYWCPGYSYGLSKGWHNVMEDFPNYGFLSSMMMLESVNQSSSSAGTPKVDSTSTYKKR